MRLTFLGTSAGIPTRYRNTSALALQPRDSSGWLLFDCGEATQHQIIKSSLILYRLKRIFITHLHGDHIYGIFGILASRGMLRAETNLEIYGPPGLYEIINTVMHFSWLKLPFELKIQELKGNEVLDFSSYRIETITLSHSVTCYGYIYIETDRVGRFNPEKARALGIPEGPLYGRLQRGESVVLQDGQTIESAEVMGPDQPGKRIIIGGDNDQPELFAPYGAVDLMIHEATYTQKDFDRLLKKFKHSTARQLGITAETMGVKSLIATHISARYDTGNHREKSEELLEEIRAYYHGEVKLARDLMRLSL